MADVAATQSAYSVPLVSDYWPDDASGQKVIVLRTSRHAPQSRLSCRWLLETLKRSMFNIINGWFGVKLTTFGMWLRFKLLEAEGSEICPLSTLKDLYKIVHDSDRVVTF